MKEFLHRVGWMEKERELMLMEEFIKVILNFINNQEQEN